MLFSETDLPIFILLILKHVSPVPSSRRRTVTVAATPHVFHRPAYRPTPASPPAEAFLRDITCPRPCML